MGPEDKDEEKVVYCDGQPVRAATELPGITTEQAAEDAAALSAVWASIGVTVKAATDAMTKIWETIMAAERFNRALRCAEAINRPLAHRYHHTKKERTRKKYAKRIMAWYQEEAIRL